jgi:L-asparaginase
MTIALLITGGTLDKDYDELSGQLIFPGSRVAQMLQQARSLLAIRLVTLMQKDSLDMTPVDREVIVRACATSPESQLVITHGTDTLAKTGEALVAARLEKTIVLTGAMRPFALGESDALFNLGVALAMVQTLPKGVYLAMNGRALPVGQMHKNPEKGVFEISDSSPENHG